MKFRGVSLSDCIEGPWPSSGPAPLVANVVKSWGVDLERGADDQEPRNISSYAVHALNPASSDLHARLELVQDIWHCLEPDGRSGFQSLDRHLLRRFLKFVEDEQRNSTFKSADLPAIFAMLDPSIQDFVPLDFLERLDSPKDPIVFAHAENGCLGDVHAMISRALLLLRVATAIVRSAFVDADFEPLADNLQAWFEPVGIARGFWSDGQQIEEISDLWNVIGLALSDLEELMASNPADQHGFLDSLSTQAVFLGQTERACMWAVCP